jgi:hypothetical protein
MRRRAEEAFGFRHREFRKLHRFETSKEVGLKTRAPLWARLAGAGMRRERRCLDQTRRQPVGGFFQHGTLFAEGEAHQVLRGVAAVEA